MVDVEWSAYPKMARRPGPVSAMGGAWAATEKIHGAHLAIVCDGATARPAKRRDLLTEAELDSFFGLSRIWPDLAVAAGETGRLLRDRTGLSGLLVLYGELAGGGYPHPDVAGVPGLGPVQTGVWYSPDLLWVLFDAVFETPDGPLWLADRELRQAAGAAGLRCVPHIAEGSRQDEHLPVAFPSLLPGLLGLPALADNLAEGLVLKPAGRWRGGARPVVKRKHPRFAEDARYQGARAYQPPEQGAAGVPGWLIAEAAARLTPVRASAVLSKLGPATPAGPLAAALLDDLVEDLEEDLGGLEPGQHTALRAALAGGAAASARIELERRVAGDAG